jgi:hypothetical protein
MSRKIFVLLMVLLGGLITGMAKTPDQDVVPRMAKEDLKAMLGAPDLVVIDVRVIHDWNESDRKIAGAVREDPAAPEEQWAGKYAKGKTIVLYCA